MNMEYYKEKLAELNLTQQQRKLSDEEVTIQRRLENFIQATELGMKYFIYAGSTGPNTLPFCKIRSGRVFSIDELMSWKNSDDRPEIENYDPILHLGGNKCEKGEIWCGHIMNFMSDFLAKKRRPDIEIQKKKVEPEVDLSPNLREDVRLLIEKKKNELLTGASYTDSFAINAFFKKISNDLVKDDYKMNHDGKNISVEEGLELISKAIRKKLHKY